jgi:hypothetical protein
MLDLYKKIMELSELKSIINAGKFPKNHNHFGGANLIITNDPNRNYHEADVVVYTDHAAALSWLVIELKKIYDAKLNSSNKYNFYPYIGELIQASVNANDDLFETMLFVMDKIEEDWGSESF